MNHSGLSPPDFSAIVHEENEENSRQIEVLQIVPPEPNWMSPLLNLNSPHPRTRIGEDKMPLWPCAKKL